MMISVYWSKPPSISVCFCLHARGRNEFGNFICFLKHNLPQLTLKQLHVVPLPQFPSSSSEVTTEDSRPSAMTLVDIWRQPCTSSLPSPCPSVWLCTGSPTSQAGLTERWSWASEVSNTTGCCQMDRTRPRRTSPCGYHHLQYLFFDCFSVFCSDNKLWRHCGNKTRGARSIEILLCNFMQHIQSSEVSCPSSCNIDRRILKLISKEGCRCLKVMTTLQQSFWGTPGKHYWPCGVTESF